MTDFATSPFFPNTSISAYAPSARPIRYAGMLARYLDKDASIQSEQITKPLWKIEKQAIEQAIATCRGNISKAATLLDINPSTIHRKKASWKNKA